MCPKMSLQHWISHKYFSWPIFYVTFAKIILILSYHDSMTNFKFRSFMSQLMFSQSIRITRINSFFNNRMMISIVALIIYLIQITKIIFTIISHILLYRFYSSKFFFKLLLTYLHYESSTYKYHYIYPILRRIFAKFSFLINS